MEIRELVSTPPAERYAVVYRVAGRPDLAFSLGAPPLPRIEAGFGTRVRGVDATLNLPQSVFSDPSAPALRRVQWKEGAYALIVSSETINGSDLLAIAWGLDMTGAPPPAFPYSRTRAGACAATTAERTLQRFVELMGSADRDAVLDCYALELINARGPGLAGGAELPAASLVALEARSSVGNRVQFLLSWRHVNASGTTGRFYLLAQEDGWFRIFEQGGAPLGPPP